MDNPYWLDKYYERRAEMLAILGSVCVVCGAADDLHIDHIDPATKSFDVSGCRYGWGVLMPELMKCQLLCAQHHREKTALEQSVPHGGGKAGKRACPCDACSSKRREHYREMYGQQPRVKAGHGTPTMYGYKCCRCGLCRLQHRNRAREYRARKRERDVVVAY